MLTSSHLDKDSQARRGTWLAQGPQLVRDRTGIQTQVLPLLSPLLNMVFYVLEVLAAE